MIDSWKLTEDADGLGDTRTRESLFSQGNGYIGWRGNFEEGHPDGLEGNYINGFYESWPIKYPEAAFGFASTGETMLNVMNAKMIKIKVDGEVLRPAEGKAGNYRRELDFRAGVLRRSFVYRTAEGKEIELHSERLLSFPRPRCGVIRFVIKPLNFDGDIEIISSIDTDVHNISSGDDPRVGSHLSPDCFDVEALKAEGAYMYAAAATRNTSFRIVCAVFHEINTPMELTTESGNSKISGIFHLAARKGKETEFTKWICYDTDKSRDRGEDLLPRALSCLKEAAAAGYEKIKAEQRIFLEGYWRRTDIEIGGDPESQQGLRFNSFHIIQSVGRDGRTAIASKGLSGEGYEGHYFWDTEMFVLPFLVYNNPGICRKLLEYRYLVLDKARERAREMGHRRGALYSWRTIGGEECSAYFPAGTAQYHINADIAAAIKKYVQAADDTDFLVCQGAEILFETARLWEDLGHYCETRRGAFCIDCVTGPDEYTAIVNNNFYTNIMARENLWYAHAVYLLLQEKYPQELERIVRKTGLADTEPPAWKKAGDLMYLPYDSDRGINLQDDSFMQKAEWDFQNTPKENYPLLLHYHPLVIYRHKVLKQADTILADFVLDKYVSPDQIRRDYEYYEKRTTHDSSLSSCIYSIVACQIGFMEKAYGHFALAVREDLDNGKKNTRDGLHLANMAGTGMCVINGFAGIRQHDDTLLINPQIPHNWEYYAFNILFKSRMIRLEARRDRVSLRLLEGASLPLVFRGASIMLKEHEVFMADGYGS